MPRVGFLFGAVTGAREVDFDAVVDAFEGCCDAAGVECVEGGGDAAGDGGGSSMAWCRVIATAAALGRMFDSGCSVVHFSGHGDERGRIALTTSAAGMDLLSPGDVGALLTGARARGAPPRTPALVVLAACFSDAVAGAFVGLGVPHVVAVDRVAVSESAMVLFAREFYSALLADGGDGRAVSVGEAFAAAVGSLTREAGGAACRCDKCGRSGAPACRH